MEFIVGALIIWGLIAGYRKLARASEDADKWLAERTGKERAEQDTRWWAMWNQTVGDAKTYPVGIVGEASYQDAIAILRKGEIVHLWHEPGNPYDARAIAVAVSDGDTIGYIPRGFWLRDALLEEDKPCIARVMRLAKGPKFTGVTIEVALAGKPLGQRDFKAKR